MAPSSLACEARRLRFRHLVLLAVVAPFCCSHVDAAKEELEYAILSDETGEMFHAKELPVGMTTNSDDCILVHHAGCTSRARWRCVTCESGDHVAADRFTSCHVKFEPVEGASLVRLTCQALNHMTEGVSSLVDTGYYPKLFPTALRKCTWPHERVPPLRPHRTKLCEIPRSVMKGFNARGDWQVAAPRAQVTAAKPSRAVALLAVPQAVVAAKEAAPLRAGAHAKT